MRLLYNSIPAEFRGAYGLAESVERLFEVRGDVTVLIGKFTMLPLVKIFMSFWFGHVQPVCRCGCIFWSKMLIRGGSVLRQRRSHQVQREDHEHRAATFAHT